MKNNATLIYNAFLVVGDFLAFTAAFLAAYLLRVKFGVGISPEDIGPSNGRQFLNAFVIIAPFWTLLFALLGLYDSSIYEKRFREFARLLIGSFIGMLFVIFWDFMSASTLFPARLVPLYGFGIGFLLLLLFRTTARLVRTALFAYNIGLTRVLIVGSTLTSRELIATLHQSHRSGYRVMGFVGAKDTVAGFEQIPSYPTFAAFLKETDAEPHRIIQTELYANEARNSQILSYAQEHHISYRFAPGNSELFVGKIEVELFRGALPVIAVHQTPLLGWGRAVKRITDVLLGGVILLISTPLLCIIALLQLLTGAGSVLFTQQRLTRFNQRFTVYKFRTQYKKYDGTTPEEAFRRIGKPELARAYRANGDFLANDPRVTPLGRFLRATSLDELPQIWNVLRGDISLVGPRALIPEELAAYTKRHTILSVKSGLTGLAQVSGRRDISFEERRKLDVYYVQNWSLWLDLVILLKTIRAVLGGSGAR